MKKIIRTFLAVVLATTVSIPNALAMVKPQQNRQAVKKQEQQLNQQINKGTTALAKAVDAKNNATTPQEKRLAHQTAIKEAKELLKDLQERSILEDVWYGYDPKKREPARAKVRALEPIRTKINENIKKLEKELAPITIVNKGWIWNSNAAKPGKEREYAILNNKLNKQKKSLAKVERAIRTQSVIAGEQWANTYRLLVAGHLIGAAYYGPTAVFYMSEAAKRKIGFALMGFNAAKTGYNYVMNDPNATQEEKDKAKENLDQKKATLDKVKQQTSTKQPTAPAKK